MIDTAPTPHARRLLPWLNALAACAAEDVSACLAQIAHPKLEWHGPHPVGALHGAEAVSRRFWQPLKHAFPDLQRRDDVVLGGASSLPARDGGRSDGGRGDGGDWLAATGHFVGTWRRDWLGLPSTGRLATLRFGEFHRLQDGRAVESRVLLDLPDLMRQAGCNPLPRSPGAEITAPGPATHDGVRLQAGCAAMSAASLRLTQGAMFGAVGQLDAPDFVGTVSDAPLAPGLMRYGPCGLGATRGLHESLRHHQRPFARAFPDRTAGGGLVHVADGAYAAHLGWPAFQATHRATYLGVPATGAVVDVRLMEFLRCERGLLAESWLLLDVLHLLLQLGRDVMEEAREAALAA